MMSEVISFPTSEDDLKYTSYTDNDGDLGVGTIDSGIQVIRLNDSDFAIVTPDGTQVHNRKSLAEFLWLAAVFMDSQERHRPDGECVACDY
jgi:hypothetical protein